MARPKTEPALADLFPVVLTPDFSIEDGLRREGLWPVAGVDEAGRGPLAGPVVTAAVILDPARIPPGLNDSKRLTAVKREALFSLILDQALAVSIATASPAEIDRTDVLKANLAAMARAVRGLAVPAASAIIDGRDVPPGLPCPGRAVVKGDARSVSIAAASIVAKVTRDRMMATAEAAFIGYGFAAHAGYGTAAHLAAIKALGPCALHRMTFRPLKGE
ncbi:RNase HII [Rhizobium sp. RU20A]|uniref:ribonuclease HII n=1 Tax=Rhizobium sp. RU20A TaxID=1907412 RepID=UPI000954B630|nr:ribonuclease HII [Rhizobium sp. RU20A]SIR08146.1 RNase HII [Rhizobium sp. RU20A]